MEKSYINRVTASFNRSVGMFLRSFGIYSITFAGHFTVLSYGRIEKAYLAY